MVCERISAKSWSICPTSLCKNVLTILIETTVSVFWCTHTSHEQKETRQSHMDGFGFSLNRCSSCVRPAAPLFHLVFLFCLLYLCDISFLCHSLSDQLCNIDSAKISKETTWKGEHEIWRSIVVVFLQYLWLKIFSLLLQTWQVKCDVRSAVRKCLKHASSGCALWSKTLSVIRKLIFFILQRHKQYKTAKTKLLCKTRVSNKWHEGQKGLIGRRTNDFFLNIFWN